MVGDQGPIQRRGWARATERVIRWEGGRLDLPPWWPPEIPMYATHATPAIAVYIPAVVALALVRVGRSKHEGVVLQIAAYGLVRLSFVYSAGGDDAVNAVLDAG